MAGTEVPVFPFSMLRPPPLLPETVLVDIEAPNWALTPVLPLFATWEPVIVTGSRTARIPSAPLPEMVLPETDPPPYESIPSPPGLLVIKLFCTTAEQLPAVQEVPVVPLVMPPPSFPEIVLPVTVTVVELSLARSCRRSCCC